jgi:hypothetical protein
MKGAGRKWVSKSDPRHEMECRRGHVGHMERNSQGKLFCRECHRISNVRWSHTTRRADQARELSEGD